MGVPRFFSHVFRLILLTVPAQDDILVHYSGYTEEDLQPALKTMIQYLQEPVTHHAFYKKYAHKKFMKGMCRVW